MNRLEEKIMRLRRRIEGLENDRKRERDEENKLMAGSSSENEDGNGKVEIGRQDMVVWS